ncbi:pseudouridine synthase [Verrucomicrobiales bacterium]|jgi:tRNA pseudouridine65 synthase|nr:pseudouridine synthase [Verrucomicrobiales bacterium]
MSLEILYQDQWLVVVNKPAGMLVHAGRDPEPDSQIAMKVVRDQIGQRVGTVHRLDRPTSGVILFALDTAIEAEMRKQFDHQLIGKKYTAVVSGKTPPEWVSQERLQKEEGEPFRAARTEFIRERLVEIEGEPFSILSVAPGTGRYHQIRKHLLGAGFPIVGDYLYGDISEMERIAALVGQPRLMLHAQRLTFFHPVEGLKIEVSADLPERFTPFIIA